MGTDAASKDFNSKVQEKNASSQHSSCLLLTLSPCAFICNCSGSSEESSEQQMSEDGMFYCSLCEVEVLENIWNVLNFTFFLKNLVFIIYDSIVERNQLGKTF